MRLYRALLRLYPASFRNEYGDELTTVFRSRRAGARGVVDGVATAIMAVGDVVPNAIAVHAAMLGQDIRYCARTLRNAPGFAITAVLVVALGVGANTAAFSVADFALLRPLPFPKPGQLVKVWERTPGYSTMEFSPGNYRDLKTAAQSYQAVGAFTSTAVNLVGSGEPTRLQAVRLTADVLPLLGVQPMLGRLFTAADTVAGHALVLGHELWQSQFGGDASVLGRQLILDGASYTVVGVMPRDFHFPTRDVALWTTLQFAAPDFEDRANNYLEVIGRLKDGVTVQAALTEANGISARLEREYPKANEHTSANVYRLADELSQRTRLLLIALCGASLCILLLACSNLASLLLARAAAREREIAVRAALGAGRERLIRQVVTESMVLAVVGGAAGILVAIAAVPALARLVPDTLPIGAQAGVDLRVLVFASAAIAFTGLGFGIVPAVRAAGPAGMRALREGARAGGGRKQRARAILVAVEVMASVVLLVSSGLLMRAMWTVQDIDPGFVSQGVLTVRTALPWPKYESPMARERFYRNVLSGVRALPGVTSAAFITGLPMSMRGGIWPVSLRGDDQARDGSSAASLRFATPQFFSTLKIPVLRGRDIQATDDANHPYVAVVSKSFADRHWPRQDPIGQQFSIAFHDRVVVGVVGDVRVRGLERPSEPQVYVPSPQVEASSLIFYGPKDLIIRSDSPASVLVPALRRIVHAADPQQPLSNIQTLGDIVANETAPRLAQLRVLAMLAAIALLLAGVGIHGLLSFSVSRRSQEIGVWLALGAQRREIASIVAREGVMLAVAGIVPGVLVAYAAGRAMQSLLAGIRPNDPTTLGVAVGLCCAVTLIGCLRPALRACGVDPIAALRAE